MSRIRSTDTAPELTLRRGLHRRGLRFRIHIKDLPGRPDIVLRRYSAAVFVHGCFWHRHAGCPLAYRPKSRVAFWQNKFSANVDRDRRYVDALRTDGWKVIIVWECALRSKLGAADELDRVCAALKSADCGYQEIPRQAGKTESLPNTDLTDHQGAAPNDVHAVFNAH